jgi:hypothetical protein
MSAAAIVSSMTSAALEASPASASDAPPAPAASSDKATSALGWYVGEAHDVEAAASVSIQPASGLERAGILAGKRRRSFDQCGAFEPTLDGHDLRRSCSQRLRAARNARGNVASHTVATG